MTSPDQPKGANDGKSIPEYLLKLVEGCSTYAKVAAKYWISCALISIVTLFSTSKNDTQIKTPILDLEIDKVQFYPLAFIIITILLVVFGSATAQAIRARQLINRAIYRPENKIVFEGNIYLQDIIDMILHPAINRVAPLAQVLQGKKQFFPEAGTQSKLIRKGAVLYYGALKLAATFVVYGLPAYALYVAFKSISSQPETLWRIPFFVFWILGFFSIITLVTLVSMDMKYTWRVIRKIK